MLARINGTRREDLYEPRFEKEKTYPHYPTLTVRLQNYDFVPLERFQAFVHRIAKQFGFKVVDR